MHAPVQGFNLDQPAQITSSTETKRGAQHQQSQCGTTATARSHHRRRGKQAAMVSPPRTTLIVKHLSEGCTGARLVRLLNDLGFFGMYDFVYVPRDIQTRCAFGFGFVNMTSHQQALRATAAVSGQTALARVCGGLEVCWSELHQGLSAQLARYRNSPIMHESVSEDFKPLLFHQGAQVAFPRSTKKIQPPQLKPVHKLKFPRAQTADSSL